MANPTEIRVANDKATLTIAFGPEVIYRFSAEFLRVRSPSAEVRGHSAADRKTVGGKRNVRMTGIEPVGNYAVKINFDDGHSTGIYSWDFFRENGAAKNQIWSDYLSELSEKGMDRDTLQII